MGYLKKLILVVLVMTLSLPAYGDRGSSAFKHGVRAERHADLEAAYGFYREAYKLTPSNTKYFAAYMRTRFKASIEHVHRGKMLRNTGALEEALKEFQRAAQIDATNYIAQQELRQTADMIRRKQLQSSVPKLMSPLTEMASRLSTGVELKPISSGLITLKITANADVVYQDLSKLAGINVLFDPDYKAQKITVDLNNVTLLQALNMLGLESKTYWQPVLKNTIFVTTDSPAKRKELEQNVMKTFYLKNISDPNELQEVANVLSKILDVNRIQLIQSQDALVVRGTMDQMILAQKLLDEVDKAKSEVVIDIAVLEVSRDRIRTLGSNLPTTEGVAYLPNGSSGSGTSGGSNGSSIVIGNFAFSVPAGSFTALASDSNSKVLQNPRIRVLNDEKATLRIGDRVPIATGSFAPGLVGAGGVSPLISTQFQYLDVGVNIDITPHIHSDREVTLKMALEISSVTGTSNIGGLSQPIIGQRRVEHSTRLADGEVNLLGGILTDSETQSLSGYPWISKIPILKYLFAQDNREHRENEIIFAITPHIVKAQEVTEDDMKVVSVGTGSFTELPRNTTVLVSPNPENHPPASSPQAPPSGAPVPDSSSPNTPSQPVPQNNPQTRR
jgi:general secretion pathway protein D